MSLIQCPECSKQVSDKAESCPHCGAPQVLKVQCEECGSHHDSNASSCPNCGFTGSNSSKSLAQKSTVSPVAILVVIAVILGSFFTFNTVRSHKTEQAQREECEENIKLIEETAESYMNIFLAPPNELTMPQLLNPPKGFETFFRLKKTHTCPCGGTYTLSSIGDEVKASCSYH